MKAPSPALRAALGGSLALAAAMGVGRFVLTPLLPPMMQALHLGKHQAGLIASANFAGYLTGALLAAAPALARRPGRWLVLGLTGTVATTAAMGVSGDLAVLAALRFVAGMASAFVLVFATVLVLDRISDGRTDLGGIHFAGVGLGIAASAILVAAAAALGADWRGLWLACGALSLGFTLAAIRLLPTGREPPAAEGGSEAPAAGGLRALLPLLAAYGLFGFGYVITATFLVAMVRASPQASAVEPMVWLLVGLSGAPSVWLWLRAAGRMGLGRAFALACLLEAAGVAIGGLVESAAAAIVAAVLLGSTFMGLAALGLALARALAPDRASVSLAAMTAAFGAGQIVGPAVGGAWAERSGSFAQPSLAAAAALVLAAALALATRRPAQS